MHAAAIGTLSGELLNVFEDVGRHNAVDKVLGERALSGAGPGTGHALFVSSRASFEIVQKTIVAGCEALISVSAPTSLAVATAERFQLLLVGFARHGSFNVYVGAERVTR